MTAPLLTARGLTVHRAGRAVLTEVDLDVRDGETLAITGPSGSGKTTLLAVLGGLEAPDAGDLVRSVEPPDTALVLQSYGLVTLLTAAENVSVPLLTPGRPSLAPSAAVARARSALDAVGLDGVADRLVESLSGGQQQRIAIARALVVRPRLLLIDEPTAALDAENRGRVLELLLDRRPPGTTVVVATHDPVVVGRTDRVLRLVGGRLVQA